MKVTADCIPCYLNQSLNAMAKGGWPEDKREEVLLDLLPLIGSLDSRMTPAENSSLVLHRLVQVMGNRDPFKKAKSESNQKALQHLPRLRTMVSQAEDPLRLAIKFAVAGNVVDMGIFDRYDLAGAIRDVLESEFTKNDYPAFRDRLEQARKLLIIGDNSGEVVFDRLLVETLAEAGLEVVYGVKGNFILNDATLEDAAEAGLHEVCLVITNGNNYLGTVAEKCSEEFLQVYREADLVISKGQANYESLEGTELAGDKTFFLLKAKCPVVAKHLGAATGDIVFIQNNASEGHS